MKKIVSTLVLSLMASQAPAQIADCSIQANLEQCIALAQQGMSNEEILATVQQALDQAAHTDSFDINVKTPDNKKVILYVVGGVVVAIGVGAGIYYYLKESKKPTNESGRSENRDQVEPREPRGFGEQVRENHEQHQEVLRKMQENVLRSATNDLRKDTEFMNRAREDQAEHQQVFFSQMHGNDLFANIEKEWQTNQPSLNREQYWAQAQAEIDAAKTKAAADHERENSEKVQREADLARNRAELARAQRVLKTMLELDRIAREQEAREKKQH
ncbi:hypothetical protein IPF37_01375 [bacterium]|nr:MAG: hypothetical protein IPF37_01375 [bacterium]